MHTFDYAKCALRIFTKSTSFPEHGIITKKSTVNNTLIITNQKVSVIYFISSNRSLTIVVLMKDDGHLYHSLALLVRHFLNIYVGPVLYYGIVLKLSEK